MVIQQGTGDSSPPAPMLDPPLHQQHSYDQVTFFLSAVMTTDAVRDEGRRVGGAANLLVQSSLLLANGW